MGMKLKVKFGKFTFFTLFDRCQRISFCQLKEVNFDGKKGEDLTNFLVKFTRQSVLGQQIYL